MNIQEFLQHHNLTRNPFSEEDAQTDPVFKEHCIGSTFHPAWGKVSGDPSEPSTSIVFGPKGSGKTAMRLQLDLQIRQHNHRMPDRRAFVIHYDDFNKFLGYFSNAMPARYRKKPEKLLQQWMLWDHMDAILCQGVTDLVDRVLQSKLSSSGPEDQVRQTDIDNLDRSQSRDLLLLAACYDQSNFGTFQSRWDQLRKRLRFRNWSTWYDFSGALVWTVLMAILFIALWWNGQILLKNAAWGMPVATLAGWLPYLFRRLKCSWRSRSVVRNMRVGQRSRSSLTRVMMQIPTAEIAGQPLPTANRTDDRYAMLEKFQMLLRQFGFTGIIVLVDRVDEPQLVNGLPDRMRMLVWPLLDNKLLKHPGLGMKLMLPRELYKFVERESREFYERARLDKQNVIPNFEWTGQALFDVVSARMAACAKPGTNPKPDELLDPAITHDRLLSAMQTLQVPRSLFRFLYKLLSDHCNQYTSSKPEFRISASTFESTLAVFQREMSHLEATT